MTIKPVQKEIIEILQEMLEQAKRGTIQNLVAVYDHDHQVRWAQVLKGGAFPAFVGGIEAVKHLCLMKISEDLYND